MFTSDNINYLYSFSGYSSVKFCTAAEKSSQIAECIGERLATNIRVYEALYGRAYLKNSKFMMNNIARTIKYFKDDGTEVIPNFDFTNAEVASIT